jgi:excisionase family DNA binding protein
MNQIQKPFTIDEAAKFLNLSKNYLYKLVHLRRIPFYKPLNGRVYFKPAELEAFIFQTGK